MVDEVEKDCIKEAEGLRVKAEEHLDVEGVLSLQLASGMGPLITRTPNPFFR